jgi:hypothetical protein
MIVGLLLLLLLLFWHALARQVQVLSRNLGQSFERRQLL